MNIWRVLKSYLIPGEFQSQSSPSVKSWPLTSGWMIGASGNPVVYADSPEGWMDAVRYNVWASNCVEARAGGVASVGFVVRRIGSDEIVKHPVVELINNANDMLLKTETSYKASGARQLSIFGDWFTLLTRESSGRVAEMYILPAHRVRLIRESWRGYVASYEYEGRVYSASDVVRIYYPSDRDPVIARSPTSTALGAINRYNLSDLAQEYIDRRGGRGGGILSFDASFLNVDIDRFMAAWDAVASDPRNAGRDAALPPGAGYMTGVLTAQQQQREERSRRLMKEIFAAYHVPPAKAGDYTDASVLANAEQQDRHFAVNFQVPELDMITESLTVDLLWREWPNAKDAGLYIAPAYEDIPALNKDAELQERIASAKVDRVVTLLQGGVISLNEARAEIGHDRVDDPRADDVLLVLGNEGKQQTSEGGEVEDKAALTLNASELATVRDAMRSYYRGDITEAQARKLLVLALPDADEDDIAELLAVKSKLTAKRRDQLDDSDFVIPETRSFPVLDCRDVEKAVSAWGRYRGDVPFEEFKRRLIRKARKLGCEDRLPEKWREEMATKADDETMPIVDCVGMTAVNECGEVVGVVEKVHRFGVHDGIKATKSDPVVIVDGRAYRASELRVIRDG